MRKAIGGVLSQRSVQLSVRCSVARFAVRRAACSSRGRKKGTGAAVTGEPRAPRQCGPGSRPARCAGGTRCALWTLRPRTAPEQTDRIRPRTVLELVESRCARARAVGGRGPPRALVSPTAGGGRSFYQRATAPGCYLRLYLELLPRSRIRGTRLHKKRYLPFASQKWSHTHHSSRGANSGLGALCRAISNDACTGLTPRRGL